MDKATVEIEKISHFADMAVSVLADDALDALGAMHLVEKQLGGARRQIVEIARSRGHSWTQIGDALGISKQAAQQRYG